MTTLRYQPVAQNPEAIALSTQAIQSVNSRLGDLAVHTNDGVVAAILTFCCHTVSGYTFGSILRTRIVSNSCEDYVQ
jgi:hypothetical protein